VLDAMGEMVTAEVVATRQLVMRDLDRTVTENEIRTAIGAVIGPNGMGEQIQISDLKKPQGGMAGMATLHLPDVEADRLLEVGRVRIGWNQCRVQERMVPMRCFQCLRFGVWAQVTSYTVFSCYISPNITTGEFERHLDDLASCVRTQGGPVIVAGDFNAKAFMWGSAVEDAKGRMLADWAAATNLVAMNRGEPTFERGGSTSVLDVTFCSPDVARRVHGWHVMEAGSTTSDHMPIEFEIAERHIATQAGCPAHGWRWAENKKDKLAEQMVMELGELSSPSAFEIQHRVEEMCDRILPKRGCLRNTMRAVFWWTGEVAFRRRDYLSKRRRLAKARRSATQRQQEDIIGNMERVSAQARKRLKKEIRAAKAKAWEKLQESVENDPWGKGYRIATGKFQKKNTAQPGRTKGSSRKTFSHQTDRRVAEGGDRSCGAFHNR
jgi:hypothetical protein